MTSKLRTTTDRFIEGPITPILLRFSAPFLVTNFLPAVNGTWGAIWASHALEANALTAVATSNVIMLAR